MADLQRIQYQMNQLSSLIQEVEAMHVMADTKDIQSKILIWKLEADAVLGQEFPNYTPEVDDFRRRWNRPMVGNNLKNGILKKLRNARTDLRLILQSEQPVVKAQPKPMLPEYAITDYAKALYGVE